MADQAPAQTSGPIEFDVVEVNVEIIPNGEQQSPTHSTHQPDNTVTDAVTQTNVEVVASSPAFSQGELSHTLSQAASLTAQNAVNSQHQLTTNHQAATTHELRRFLFDQAGKLTSKNTFNASLKKLTDIMKILESLQR